VLTVACKCSLLNQVNAVSIVTHYFSISSHRLDLPSGCFPSVFLTEILHSFLVPSVLATYPTHLFFHNIGYKFVYLNDFFPPVISYVCQCKIWFLKIESKRKSATNYGIAGWYNGNCMTYVCYVTIQSLCYCCSQII
jgi:hypothetical protein